MRRNLLPRKKRTEDRMDEELLKWIIFAIVGAIVVVLSILLITHD